MHSIAHRTSVTAGDYFIAGFESSDQKFPRGFDFFKVGIIAQKSIERLLCFQKVILNLIHAVYAYSDKISTIFRRLGFTSEMCLIAFLNGVKWIFPLHTPIISPLRPSINDSTAATPRRLAST